MKSQRDVAGAGVGAERKKRRMLCLLLPLVLLMRAFRPIAVLSSPVLLLRSA